MGHTPEWPYCTPSMAQARSPRYAAWRKSWGSHQILGAFIFVFLVQAILFCVVATPVIAIMLSDSAPLDIFSRIGTLLWLVGFACEVMGDMQLTAFLKDPKNHGKVMTKGLWHYSRHPNYFGEIVMWWGIFVIALSTPYGFLTIIGPATITYLITYISGVPLAEKSLSTHPDFTHYRATTSVLVPLPKSLFARVKTKRA